MGLIVLYDKTNHRKVPNAHVSIAVNPSDDLKIIMQQLAFTIEHSISTAVPGCYNELHIVCSCTQAGLMLGHGIDHNNVAEIFKPLRYKIGNIIIHNPGAAFIYSDGNNGVLLCKRLSRSVFANVTATANLTTNIPLGYMFKRATKAHKTNISTATWNCTGKIAMLNTYDEKGKLIYSINFPGSNAMQFVLKAKTNETPSGLYIFRKKILRYSNRLGHYLYTHVPKLSVLEH